MSLDEPWFVHVWARSPTQGFVEVGTYEFQVEVVARLFPSRCSAECQARWWQCGPNVEFRVDQTPPYDPAMNQVGCYCDKCRAMRMAGESGESTTSTTKGQ